MIVNDWRHLTVRKQHPFNFKKWHQFLINAEGVQIPWVEGEHMTTHPVYDEQMMTLAQAFEWSDYYDQNYDRTLHQKGLDQLREEEVVIIARTSRDFQELRAVTSVIIHEERHLEGMWAAMLEKGILLRLLQRLESQKPIDFPGPNY